MSASSFSIAAIFSTRRSCRPPANGVASHRSTIRSASSSLRTRAPSASTLALLCSRLICASCSLLTLAARMPATLLAAMAHANSTPAHQDAYMGALLAHVVRYETGVVRIIDGLARPRAFVQELEPSLLKVLSHLVLEFVTSVICAQCYLHTVILPNPGNRSQQK